MKNLKTRLLLTTFFVVITVIYSSLPTGSVLLHNVSAQTVGNTNGGPQDGGDGKKKPKCRPPRCPAVPTTNPGPNTFTEASPNDEISDADLLHWWDELVDWIFGD